LPVAIADFNQDGIPDIVSGVSTLLGNGDGTFRSGTRLNLVLMGQYYIATADFNGDGKPDIAFLNLGGSSPQPILIFLGKGDGTFQSPISITPNSSFVNFVVADVNHDGIPDVLTVDGGALIVYLGKGDGTFTQLPPNFTQSVQFVGDFNGDGKPDILWRSSSGLTVDVALGNGDGTFQSPALISGLSGRIAAVADFNNDGKLDLGVAVPSCNGAYCTFAFGVQLGNGDGTFQSIGPQIAIPPTKVYTPYSVGIAVGDLNGDGRMDVVYAIDFNQIVGTLIGNGDGTFTYGSSYGVGNGGGPNGIAVADLNGDHKLDIVEGQLPGLLLSVLIGHGDGTFAAASAFEVTPSVGIPVTADFNGDGKPDLALLSQSAIAIFLDTPNGLVQTGNFSNGLTETPGFFAAADLKHDGKQDLLIGAPGNTVVFIGNGDGTFGSPLNLSGCGGTNATVQGLGDFNGDHIPDVISTGGGLLYICLGKGDGTFGAPTQYLAGSGPGQVAIGDFNGDGKLDVAVASPTEIGLLLGNGDGTFQPVTIPISYGKNNYVYNLAAADVNLDGKLDIIVLEEDLYGETQLQISLGNGDGTFRTLSAQNLGSPYGPIAVSDLNGDGKPDLLISGSFYPALCLGHAMVPSIVGRSRTEAVPSPISMAMDDPTSHQSLPTIWLYCSTQPHKTSPFPLPRFHLLRLQREAPLRRP
jgi:hypothetical protein